MKLQQAPQPVLCKLLALDQHAEALAADADDAAAKLEYARAVLNNRIEDPRIDLAATRTEFERLLQEVPRARARADAEQKVLSNVKLWLDQLPFNTKLLYEPTVVADGQDLGSVRTQLATAEREISALRSAPVAAPDIEQRVSQYVEGLARAGAPLPRGFGPNEQLQLFWPEGLGGNRMNSAGFARDSANPLLLAARLLPQQLAQLILSEIAELTRGQDERPARIAELEQQVAQLRRLEEALIVKAIAAGDNDVFRDPNAPSEAILEVQLRAEERAGRSTLTRPQQPAGIEA